jgi:hypothetical protein
MAIETDERMARVEHTCQRIAERLGLIEHRLTTIEPRLASGLVSLGYELKSALDSLRSELRAGDGRLGKQEAAHFYWLLVLIAGSLLLILALEVVP